MKLLFIVITILFNLFNHSSINSEEKNDLGTSKIENIVKKELSNEDKTENKKIHIVKSGETLSSISKLYLIKEDLIIKLNNIKDQNYIFIGQNLIISESNKNNLQLADLNNYHIVQIGENLTEISNKYNLKIESLLEINNLKNPDSIKVGEKILLSKNNPSNSENLQINKNEKKKELLDLDKQIYGPIIIKSKSYANNNDREVLNILNQENQKLILSINCEKNELDVRVPGKKWMGAKPAKEEFEKDLINDFC